jgi:hypothetical protein
MKTECKSKGYSVVVRVFVSSVVVPVSPAFVAVDVVAVVVVVVVHERD